MGLIHRGELIHLALSFITSSVCNLVNSDLLQQVD